MKRKFAGAALLMCLAAGAFMVQGCSKANPDGSSKENNNPRKLNVADYVTLGEYKGISITKTEPKTYTDADFDETIRRLFDQYEYYTLVPIEDRDAAENGDTLQIEYTGYMDGKPFAGGNGSANLTLGSNSFIPGFEEGLVGAKAGEEVTLDISFPDPYPNNPDFSGKPCQFKVTVKGLFTKEMDEFTDEFAKEMGYESAEQCRKKLISEQNQQYVDMADTANEKAALTAIIDGSTFSENFPEELWQEYYDEKFNTYATYADENNIPLGSFLATYADGMTVEELQNMSKDYADEQCRYYLVLMSIAEKEGITASDKEVESYEDMQKESFTMTDEEYSKYTNDIKVEEHIMSEKAMDLIMENVVY